MVQLSLDVVQQGLVAVDEARKAFGWLWPRLIRLGLGFSWAGWAWIRF